MKRRIFQIIQVGSARDTSSRIFDVFICAPICLNIVMIVLDTFPMSALVKDILYIAEAVVITVFAIEYALRVWTSDLLYTDDSRGKAACRYTFIL